MISQSIIWSIENLILFYSQAKVWVLRSHVNTRLRNNFRCTYIEQIIANHLIGTSDASQVVRSKMSSWKWHFVSIDWVFVMRFSTSLPWYVITRFMLDRMSFPGVTNLFRTSFFSFDYRQMRWLLNLIELYAYFIRSIQCD